MFERLGSWTYRFRFLIVIAWVIAGVFMGLFAPSLAGAGSTDQTSFLPDGAPSKAAQEALERAFPGSTSASSATITLHRAGGLTAEDLAYRDAYAAWATSDEAPAELHAAATETETAEFPPRARDAAPERGRLVRDPRHQPRRRRRRRQGDGRRRAAPRASRRDHAGRPRDPRHGRGRDQLRLPRGGQGRHRQHDRRDDHPRRRRPARDLPRAARRPHPADHDRRGVCRLDRRARVPRRGGLAGQLDPRHVPRRDGVRRRHRLRDLPHQPLPRGGLERGRLARCRADHRAPDRRRHHRQRRHGHRGHARDGRRRLQDDRLDGARHRHRGRRDARRGPHARPGAAVDLRPLPVLAAPYPEGPRGRAARLLREPRLRRLAPPGPGDGGTARPAPGACPVRAADEDELRRPDGPADRGRLAAGLRGDRRAPGRGQARPVDRAHRRRRWHRHARAGPAGEAPRHPRRAPRIGRHRHDHQPHHARRRHDGPGRLPAQRDAAGDGRRVRAATAAATPPTARRSSTTRFATASTSRSTTSTASASRSRTSPRGRRSARRAAGSRTRSASSSGSATRASCRPSSGPCPRRSPRRRTPRAGTATPRS